MTRKAKCGALAAVLALGVSVPLTAHAESAADVLLQSVGAVQDTAIRAQNLKLDDPFKIQLFAAWQNASGLSFEVSSWIQRVLQGNYAEAAHQWSSIRPLLPAQLSETGAATWCYLLWKMDLGQSFFDEWSQQLAHGSFSDSRIAIALEQVVSPGFDQWLSQHAIQISSVQETALKRSLSREGQAPGAALLTVSAWAALRKGEAAMELLPKLTDSHSLKIPLARTAVVALARKRDLAGAGKVLKGALEPAVRASGDARELASYYLSLARLLYQAGAMESAEGFYEKIPSGSSEYLKAREELAWVWLRRGDTSKLRGALASLGSPAMGKRFAPEVRLVRAISNLKLCFYDEVEKDFAEFIRINRGWAAKIDAALNAQVTPDPEEPDTFSRMAELQVKNRESEAARLETLSVESIRAALPAVGPQAHWVKLKGEMQAHSRAAIQSRASEIRRQWEVRRIQLVEAIRKMQFVKVEFMSQLRLLAKKASGELDEMRLSQAAPRRAEEAPKPALQAPGKIIFPFDGLLWPDELFKLRSVARERCLAGGGGA
jgi:tetratricopeptide (TPR) repeat protein